MIQEYSTVKMYWGKLGTEQPVEAGYSDTLTLASHTKPPCPKPHILDESIEDSRPTLHPSFLERSAGASECPLRPAAAEEPADQGF